MKIEEKKRSYKIVIVGSGFGGQCAAIQLNKKGINDFIILERRNFIGGTWCQNTYPGAAVDVHSPLYSFSFEPYQWKRMFANQSELKEYTAHVIHKYDLKKKTQLNTTVKDVQWNRQIKNWEIKTNQGDFVAQFIINASGALSIPVIPEFQGKNLFLGKSFHTNKWDHSFNYKNKKVAIIGSGASAAQVIPAIASAVKELHVFQRTAHWVLPKPDFTFPKWLQKILAISFCYKIIRYLIYWGLETRVLGFKYSKFMLKIIAERKAKKLLKRNIKNEALREKLTPNYTIGCKRILLSNTLYPAFNTEQVKLYTKEQGIKEITPENIITHDGKEIKIDAIIYATGYAPGAALVSYKVIGKKGKDIREYWKEYARAYLGTMLPDFPNFFIITGPNTGIGHTSALFIIEAQMNYIVDAILQVKKEKKKTIEVTKVAEEKYTKMIQDEMSNTVWQNGGCHSWYKNEKGKVTAIFPGFSFTFWNMTKKIKIKDHIIE